MSASGGGSVEVRRDADGRLDEIVASQPRFFHMEDLGNGDWLILLDLNERGRRVRIRFKTRGVVVEEEP